MMQNFLRIYVSYTCTFDKQEHCYTCVRWFCRVGGCASSVGMFPVALGPSFLDKGVKTGPVATQFDLTCAQTKPGLPGMCLRQAKLFQTSCDRQT